LSTRRTAHADAVDASVGSRWCESRRWRPHLSSALDAREIDIAVALPCGAYRFDPAVHALQLVCAQDVRRATGYQDFVDEAPLDFSQLGRLRQGQASASLPAVDTCRTKQDRVLCTMCDGVDQWRTDDEHRPGGGALQQRGSA
jgi:hypothetical protein